MESKTQHINETRELQVIPEKSLTFPSDATTSKIGFRRYMCVDYINQVLSAMPPGTDRMLCQFLWMTGVRISEALSISKKDINFRDMVIRIRWLKSRRYTERNIPIHPSIKEILYFYVGTLNLEDKLFPFTRQRAYQITKKWFLCNPHAFRHSFAVNWLRCHGDITILSRYLGHARLQETAEYLKIAPIDQGKELLKVNFG